MGRELWGGSCHPPESHLGGLAREGRTERLWDERKASWQGVGEDSRLFQGLVKTANGLHDYEKVKPCC